MCVCIFVFMVCAQPSKPISCACYTSQAAPSALCTKQRSQQLLGISYPNPAWEILWVVQEGLIVLEEGELSMRVYQCNTDGVHKYQIMFHTRVI